MHKRTRVAMEQVARILRSDRPLDEAKRAALAAVLEGRVKQELAEFDRRMAAVRAVYADDRHAVSSGRINRPSHVEMSQPPGDR